MGNKVEAKSYEVKAEYTKLAESLIEISKNNQEPDCLKDYRLRSFECYSNESLPDRVSHIWRYSDPKLFCLNGNETINHSPSPVFSLGEMDIKKGLVLAELKDAFKVSNFKEIIKSTFGKLINKSTTKLTYLNEAFWSGGYFLYVPKGLKVELPVTVKFNSVSTSGFQAGRALVILEEDASISLIDEFFSENKDSLITNYALEMFLHKGARLTYLNFQGHGKDTTHYLLQNAFLAEHTELTNLIVAIGGKASKVDMLVDLNGYSSNTSIYGIVLGDENQKFDHHTRVEHNAPMTKSILNFRVALKDKARSAYTGNLKIDDKAIKSDASQENRNLLLSPYARAESIPELEISTNDVVRCNHGVTVGQVDKEQIFYLMSRGLSEKEAERIIIEGFVQPTISRVPDDKLREEINKNVNLKLSEAQ